MKKKLKIILILIITFLIVKYTFTYFSNYQPKIKEVNFTYKKDLLKELKKMSKEDERINKIMENYKVYPEELLEMLSRNMDMVDFVLEYPDKKNKIYSDNVGKVTKGKIPLLLQYDKRWGYAKYEDNILAINGCGPTALSMVYTGLTGNNKMTPFKIAEFSSQNGYYMEEGTSWYLMSEGALKLGLKSKELTLSKSLIYSSLEAGNPIICSMRKGDFTATGHFIVLTEIENGLIKVHDPNSQERSEKLWSYERLKPQIKNLWSFSI